MAADASTNPFKDGRANLRDTAKWMVSGALGAATLIAGSSTISQLGAMDTVSPRFWVAVVALIVAAGLCWVPFIRAVDVLRSEVLTLERFVEAPSGEFKDAADAVSGLLTTLPEGKSLREFFHDYRALRSEAWAQARRDKAAAEKAVADLDDRLRICQEACVSQLVADRFERLVEAIKCPGSIILLTFLLFTWAANPPKDAVKLFDKPYVEVLSPERAASLKAAKVDPACYAAGAQLVAVGAPDAGPQTAVLVPPEAAAAACAPRNVTLSAGRIVSVN